MRLLNSMKKRRYFIITVDTEGDNLWDYKEGEEVQTKNALFIPRFQELCEKYGFKPVYLTNYEMILSSDFVQYIKPKVEAGLCEVGIHIHAWNNPPYYELNGPYNGNPYLIEYPYEVMREKFKVTYDLICDRIGDPPVSHRAGRWAMNDDYFRLLKDCNVKVDCSYTPLVSWSHCPGKIISAGPDYTKASVYPSVINGVLEVPMTYRKKRFLSNGSLKHKIKMLIKGDLLALRPAIEPLENMKKLCANISMDPKVDYVELMIHSSELMPGGSPYFKDEHSIESLYNSLFELFEFAKKQSFEGITLGEYAEYIG